MNTTKEWEVAPEHPGYITRTIKRGSVTIEVYRPELEQAERDRRERQIKAVLEKVLPAYYYRKEENL